MKTKKYLLSAIATILCFFLFACAETTPKEELPASNEPEALETVEETNEPVSIEEKEEASVVSADTDRHYKIGYTFWDLPIAGICIDSANQLKLAEEALGVEVLFNPDNSDFSAESMVNAVQSFADEGCDAVIVVNFSEESMLEISDICKENNMYFLQSSRTLTDESIKKEVEANPFFVGRICEDEYGAAYDLAMRLAETGAKNIALISSFHGDTSYETRAQAYKDACKDFEMNLVAELWDLPDDDTATGPITELLTNHPEIDGIVTVKSNFAPYIVEAEKNVGKTEWLPIVGVDFDTSLGEMIVNNQILAVAGGHQANATFSLAVLLNALSGGYSDSTYPIEITNAMMTISGTEEYDDYCKWCIGYDEDFYNRQVLTMDEIRNICIRFNPGASLDDIKALAGNMSLNSVKARHSGLFQ